MEGKYFLFVASNLKNYDSEAERRTSISRAYYAVFNHIATLLRENKIELPKESPHKKMTHYLNNCGVAEIENLSSSINDLRAERNKADYDMGCIKFNKNTCQLLFLKAKSSLKKI